MLMHRNTKGFTLVELLIVIVVIAILAAISIVAYNGIQDRARKAAQQAALTQTEKSIMTWSAQELGESPLISGTLIALQEGVGSTSLSKPLVNAQNVTMYGVWDITNSDGAWAAPAGLAPAPAGSRFYFQSANSGASGMGFRIDTSAQANVSSAQGGVRSNTPKRVIGWIQASASSYAFGINQATSTISGTLSPHTGFSYSSLSSSNVTGISSVSHLVFNTSHDEATRLQVMKWLADKYNVSLSI